MIAASIAELERGGVDSKPGKRKNGVLGVVVAVLQRISTARCRWSIFFRRLGRT